MLYYTQLIFIKPGCEAEFHAFEDIVLPLLAHHGGKLRYRVRPNVDAYIQSDREQPYEIHIVSFEDKAGFIGYAADPQRIAALNMKDRSVDKLILIEGKML